MSFDDWWFYCIVFNFPYIARQRSIIVVFYIYKASFMNLESVFLFQFRGFDVELVIITSIIFVLNYHSRVFFACSEEIDSFRTP